VLDATVNFLEGGCSLIVGVSLADGSPYAAHAWGFTVESRDPVRARLVLGTRDAERVPALWAGAPIAVTGADVSTLRAVQVKGRSIDAGPATDDDLAVVARHCGLFFADVERVDGEPYALLVRMVPPSFTTCTVELDAFFDQTPGPGAGAPLARTGG